nr:uncharacterized protein LOC109151056 isoform X3 [Ipomoea batatas]
MTTTSMPWTTEIIAVFSKFLVVAVYLAHLQLMRKLDFRIWIGYRTLLQLEDQNQVMQQQQQDMQEENRSIRDIVQKMEATVAHFSASLSSHDQDPNKSSNEDTLPPPPPMMIHYPL